MTTIRPIRRRGLCAVLWAAVAALAAPTFAQDAAPPPAPVVAVEAGVDVANQYLFRGVRQNTTGLVVWPHGEVVVRALADAGIVERLGIGFLVWNSLNTGDTGSGGPAGRAWYESRVGASALLQLDGGLLVRAGYTTYISPNELFTTTKEAAVAVEMDDTRWLGRAAVRPYALVAFEIDAAPGRGQLDGGQHAGRYLELGAAPGFDVARARVRLPVRVGMSLGHYYELGDRDHRFGFASLGSELSVPIGGRSPAGQWHVRGGVTLTGLGDTTRVFSGGDRLQTTASIGLGIGR